MNKSYFTVKEVAAIMDVHPSTVRNWIKSGKLKAVKCCHTIRIPSRRITTWIKSLKKKHYTICEVAYILDVDETTVRRWVKERRLPAIRCGGTIRILAEQVDEWKDELYPTIPRSSM
jgi:excisionase family DNA binding protein